MRPIPGSSAGVGNRLFLSRDQGTNWTQIGLQSGTVADLAFNGATTRLYATVYARRGSASHRFSGGVGFQS